MADLAFRQREGGAKALVLLHGLQTNKSVFDDFFSSSLLSEFSLLAVDLLGFGDSIKPRDSDYSLETQAEAVLRTVRSVGIEKYSILGHSLGGMVGTLLSQTADVERLISLEGNLTEQDCGASLRACESTAEEFSLTYEKMRAKLRLSANACDRIRGTCLMQTPDFVFYRSSRTIVDCARSERLLRIFEARPKNKLLIVGEHGNFSSRPRSVQVETIGAAGHFMLIENLAATICAIAKFLTR